MQLSFVVDPFAWRRHAPVAQNNHEGNPKSRRMQVGVAHPPQFTSPPHRTAPIGGATGGPRKRLTTTPDSIIAAQSELEAAPAAAPVAAAVARAELFAALQADREREAMLSEAVRIAQYAHDKLCLEHAAEAIDGRVMGNTMLSRLAAAQAVQAAAIAQRLAAGESLEKLMPSPLPSDDAEPSLESLLAPLDALQVRHRAARLAVSDAVERERVEREAIEADELTDARAALHDAEATLEAKLQQQHPQLPTPSAVGASSAVDEPAATLPRLVEAALEAAVELTVDARIRDARAPLLAKQVELEGALNAAVAAAMAAREQTATHAARTAQLDAEARQQRVANEEIRRAARERAAAAEHELQLARMALAGGKLGSLAMGLGVATCASAKTLECINHR